MEREERPAFGQFRAVLRRGVAFGPGDALAILAVAGLILALVTLARRWTAPMTPAVTIDLSPSALPAYTLLSLSRGVLAYLLSFLFTLVYGTWAAKDARAGRVLIPLLDILQSIPVLGFLPGTVLALVAAFPHSNIGLELAAVLMIFTGQVWNMVFSYYHSLRSVPAEYREVAELNHFGRARTLSGVELPFSTIGLVWNSMVSVAGGWFFLTITESFTLGDRDFRLPGLGSYMSVAVARGDRRATVMGLLAMIAMIVVLDQLVWRPLVAWSQRFRVEEGGAGPEPRSWVLDLLRRAHFPALRRARPHRASRPHGLAVRLPATVGREAALVALLLLVGGLAIGGLFLWREVSVVSAASWLRTLELAGLTLLRVLASTAIGTLWAVPAGLAIGLSPRLSRLLQPVIQVAASFPAPMLFPLVTALLVMLGIPLDAGAVALMLLGTQWYILFNVVAGTTAIPADLREVSSSFGVTGLRRMRALLLPSVFPYLVTGWITAAGGAWNASIVSEYVSFRGQVLEAHGVGAQITASAASADFPLLAASVLVMSALVVGFNRLVWRRLYQLAQTRYALSR